MGAGENNTHDTVSLVPASILKRSTCRIKGLCHHTRDNFFFFLTGAGEMGSAIRNTDLAEEPGLNSSTHMVAKNPL